METDNLALVRRSPPAVASGATGDAVAAFYARTSSRRSSLVTGH